MQYFYDYEMAHGGEGFSFTLAIVASYQEPDELTALANDTTTKGQTLKRIAQIRCIPK